MLPYWRRELQKSKKKKKLKWRSTKTTLTARWSCSQSTCSTITAPNAITRCIPVFWKPLQIWRSCSRNINSTRCSGKRMTWCPRSQSVQCLTLSASNGSRLTWTSCFTTNFKLEPAKPIFTSAKTISQPSIQGRSRTTTISQKMTKNIISTCMAQEQSKTWRASTSISTYNLKQQWGLSSCALVLSYGSFCSRGMEDKSLRGTT